MRQGARPARARFAARPLAKAMARVQSAERTRPPHAPRAGCRAGWRSRLAFCAACQRLRAPPSPRPSATPPTWRRLRPRPDSRARRSTPPRCSRGGRRSSARRSERACQAGPLPPRRAGRLSYVVRQGLFACAPEPSHGGRAMAALLGARARPSAAARASPPRLALRCSPPPRPALPRPRRRCAPPRAKGPASAEPSGGANAGADATERPSLSPAAADATAAALAAIASADAQAEAPTNLVLIGGRGCGKSSLCRRISALDSRWQLFPLDTLVSYEADGLSIAEIVAQHGARCRDGQRRSAWHILFCVPDCS